MCSTIRDSVRMLFNYKLLADIKVNFEKEESENQLIEKALKF